MVKRWRRERIGRGRKGEQQAGLPDTTTTSKRDKRNQTCSPLSALRDKAVEACVSGVNVARIEWREEGSYCLKEERDAPPLFMTGESSPWLPQERKKESGISFSLCRQRGVAFCLSCHVQGMTKRGVPVDELFQFICEEEERSIQVDNSRKVKRRRTTREIEEEASRHTNQQTVPQFRLPSSWDTIVGNIEDKYKHKGTEGDYLVDLGNLTVTVPTKDNMARRQANGDVLPPMDDNYSESEDPDYMVEHDEWSESSISEEALEDDFAPTTSRRTSSTPKHVVPPSRKEQTVAIYKPVRGNTRHSAPAVMYDQPLFSTGTTSSSLVVREPPLSSVIFNLEFQKKCLEELYQMLATGKADDIKLNLEEKIINVLGTSSIPSPDCKTVIPFIIFDDNGEMNITFLFDAPPNTFWTSFLRNSFGAEYLNRQREVYTLLRARIGNPGFFASQKHIIPQLHNPTGVTAKRVDIIEQMDSSSVNSSVMNGYVTSPPTLGRPSALSAPARESVLPKEYGGKFSCPQRGCSLTFKFKYNLKEHLVVDHQLDVREAHAIIGAVKKVSDTKAVGSQDEVHSVSATVRRSQRMKRVREYGRRKTD